MNKIAFAVALILACATVPGAAEDSDKQAKTPWDIGFGGALMSDYNFRGISLSDHRPAVWAYFEPRYDFSSSLQAYVNVTTHSITIPNYAPSASEIYGGVRPTFDRLALDFGFWEYLLPGVRCFNFEAPGGRCVPQLTVPYVNSIPKELSYWEVYAKAAYSLDSQISFGGYVDWTPTVLNSGAEATYVAGWAKYILPPTFLPYGMGWFVSAEAGHWFRDTSPYPSYSNWNAGLAFTWKQLTLDLRYSDTDHHDCAVPVAAINHTSNRCGPSFVATLAFDMTKANVAGSGSAMDSNKQTKSPWDIAFGSSLMSDFIFRGLSASDHRPAVSAYFEPRYDFSDSLQAYVQIAPYSITLPNHAAPVVEMYEGVRPTFDRLSLDFAVWEHWLVGGQCFNFQAPGGVCIPQLTVPYVNSVPAHLSYWEALASAIYHVDEQLSFSGRVAWTPSVLNSGAEATYVAGWAKYILPHAFLPKDIGWFISAEAGHWFRDGSPYPSYTNWNAGLAFTWKEFTLDLRYSNTDRRDCDQAVTAAVHDSNRCGASFIAKLSVDLTKKNLR
jgi:uncharacterized protein Gcw-chp